MTLPSEKKQYDSQPRMFSIGAQCLLLVLVLSLLALLFVPKHEFYSALDIYFSGLSQFVAPGSWFETELWNAGHFVLFFLFAYLTGSVAKSLLKVNALPWHIAFLLLVIFLLLGLLIEYIQIQVGRSFAYSDVWLDGLGAAAGLFLLIRVPAGVRIVLSLLCILIGLSSLLQAAMNLYRMHDEFPVLFDRPDALSLKRLTGNASFVVQKEGREAYLQVEFGTDNYSDLALTQMVRDWSSFKQLVMEWYNPAQNSLSLTCRIHDKLHKDSGNATDDRFNRKVIIEPGKNRVDFDLSQVQRLPNNRQMEMDSIMALMCFSTHLQQPRKLLLDKIYLQ